MIFNAMKNKCPAILLLAILPLFANAQSLPNVQTKSVRAPSQIKIDGKLDEWNGKLQANNPTNRLFYTISNDDDKLYLTILITDGIAVDKVLLGGLVFTVSRQTTNARKKDINNSTIFYPVVNRKISDALRGNIHVFFSFKGDEIKNNQKHLDSLVIEENKRADIYLTEIQVAGLKGIGDTTISIYNNEGIHAALKFGKGMTCTYELAVPLKYLDLSINNNAQFSYNVKLNGASLEKSNPRIPAEPVAANGEIDHNHEFDVDPTDFWGTYTLAKKP